MTSGSGSAASTVAGAAPHNGENKPPQAVVKPQILTHVIEGFVIQEGAEPFPVSFPPSLTQRTPPPPPPPSPGPVDADAARRWGAPRCWWGA